MFLISYKPATKKLYVEKIKPSYIDQAITILITVSFIKHLKNKTKIVYFITQNEQTLDYLAVHNYKLNSRKLSAFKFVTTRNHIYYVILEDSTARCHT